MEDRAISQDALIHELTDITDNDHDMICVGDVIDIIKRLPSVNPQPTGHWICGLSWKCSECGYEDDRALGTDFCPNCGCRMIEPQERSE